MRFRRLEFAVLASLAGCGGDPVAMVQSNIVTINIYDFYYSPAGTTVRAGTEVHWVNNGPSAHTTTSDTGIWDSGSLAAPTSGGGGTGTPPPSAPPPSNPYPMLLVGGTFSTTFSNPGVYGFHCSIHPPATQPGFVGTVTVTE